MRHYQPFRFKQFSVHQDKSAMKVGTDGVLLGAWTDVGEARLVLDIGTGTGLLALMLAQKQPAARFHALEPDQPSFEQACQNFAESPWAGRFKAFPQTLQTFLEQTSFQYDLLISNPPFFSNDLKSNQTHRNHARHTDETLPHPFLAQAAARLLAPDGRFAVILPYSEGLGFQELMEKEGLFCTKKVAVKGRLHKPLERWLLEFERTEKMVHSETLIIQNSAVRHDYTAEFVDLVKDFYTIIS